MKHLSILAAASLIIYCFQGAAIAEDNFGRPAVKENTIAALKPGLLINILKPEGIAPKTLLSVVREGKIIGAVEVVEILGKDIATGQVISGEGEIEIGDIVVKAVKLPDPPAPDAKTTQNSNPASPPANGSDTAKTSEGAGNSAGASKPPTVEELQKRIETLEKRISELERIVKEAPTTTQKPARTTEQFDNEPTTPEYDKTIDKMLESKPEKKPEPATGKQPPEPPPASRDLINTAEGIDAKNPDDVPVIEGKIVGTYNKNKDVGIAVNKGHKVKSGYIFYIYRKEGDSVKLIAKVKITDTTSCDDTVGGYIILQLDKIKKTDLASTRMPAVKE
jgi:hypothetical protein